MTREDVFGSARKMMVNLAALRPAIADPTPLREMLLRSTPSRDFSDLQLPLTAVAADVTTGHHVELNSGDLISALMASTAIPGVFPVVEREGAAIGRWRDPLQRSHQHRRRTGCADDRRPRLRLQPFAPRTEPTLPHALLRAAAIMASSQVRRDLLTHPDKTILYVPGKWPPASMPYDFSKAYENGTESYEIAMDWLEGLKIKGAGLYGEPPRRHAGRVVNPHPTNDSGIHA